MECHRARYLSVAAVFAILLMGCAGAHQDCPPPSHGGNVQAVVAKNAAAPAAAAKSADKASAGSIDTRVDATAAGELVVMQALVLRAPIAEVWRAYTTSAGWQGWVAPLAEVDLRVGGIIRTNYNPNGALGDESTNTLRVISYVPERMLTLQADVAKNWPEFMKAEAGQMYNVVLFAPLDNGHTRITAYGVGMKDDKRYRELIGFFTDANAKTYERLRTYVEGPGTGK